MWSPYQGLFDTFSFETSSPLQLKGLTLLPSFFNPGFPRCSFSGLPILPLSQILAGEEFGPICRPDLLTLHARDYDFVHTHIPC